MVTAGSAMLQQGMLCKMVCCVKQYLPPHVPARSMADGPTQARDVRVVHIAQRVRLAQQEHAMLPHPDSCTGAESCG